jgi:site-specific recombinase XerD
VPGSPAAPRDRAILALLTTTGLRAEELCGLSLDQLHEGSLTVRITKQGGRDKGTCWRTVPLPQETEGYVRAYLTNSRRPCRKEEPTLFLTHDGYPLDKGVLAQIVQAAAERAQLAERHVTVALIRYSVGAMKWSLPPRSAAR